MTQTILLPFIDSSKRKVKSCKKCQLILGDKFVEYHNISTFLEEDEELAIMVEKESDYHFIRRRDHISNIDRYYDNKELNHCVTLEFVGCDFSPTWFFDDVDEHIRVYTILSEYFINS